MKDFRTLAMILLMIVNNPTRKLGFGEAMNPSQHMLWILMVTMARGFSYQEGRRMFATLAKVMEYVDQHPEEDDESIATKVTIWYEEMK